MKQLKSILVVGGGTAGFVSALILKTRFPHMNVKVVRSKKIGIIGVGEGSTEHWNEFLQYIGVKWQKVIQFCDATFKCGIMFKGWGDNDYLHSIGPEYEIRNGQYPTVYGKLLATGAPRKQINPAHVWDNKLYSSFLKPDSSAPYNQYHFNTHKLNDFLTKVTELKGIEVVDDEINDIELNEQGEISILRGEKENYSADFYIDCTGFRKLLISKLGAKWQSYSQYLKMKSAIVFPMGDTDEYNIWTIAQAMKNGWMFKIPVWGRSGNGYIFDSDHLTPEQAQQEVEEFLGQKIEIGKHLQFDPGALDKVWIKNCCAIGLSASFVEPLEATSIGSSIQQAFLLMHRLPNYNEKTIEKYNKDATDILTNIRDFVILHYVTSRRDTDFWKSVADIKLPDTLQANLEKWRTNLPIADDFRGQTDYIMFRDSHHLQILAGLNLFDLNAIRNEYEMMSYESKKVADDFIRQSQTAEKQDPNIGHKEFITAIRNGKY